MMIRKCSASGITAGVAGLMLSGLIGCGDPQPGAPTIGSDAYRVMNMPTDPNVVQVVAFFDPPEMNPWIWAEDQTRVRGIIINSLYLGGSEGKGVFGDGVIRPKLYVARQDDQGKTRWEVVREWSFDVQEAMPFRTKKQTVMGWGYGLIPLDWGDKNLAHQLIRISISFECSNGRVVTRRSRQEYRVPAGY